MKTYQVRVFETRTLERIYEVDADTLEEAEAKAEIGDTVIEFDAGYAEVIERTLLGPPTELPAEA